MAKRHRLSWQAVGSRPSSGACSPLPPHDLLHQATPLQIMAAHHGMATSGICPAIHQLIPHDGITEALPVPRQESLWHHPQWKGLKFSSTECGQALPGMKYSSMGTIRTFLPVLRAWTESKKAGVSVAPWPLFPHLDSPAKVHRLLGSVLLELRGLHRMRG